MRALWVLPSIDRGWGDACLASLRVPAVLWVDNAPPNENTGVTRPWNLGRAAALASGFDYLVLCSESLRFGAAGGRDVEAGLDGSPMVLSPCKGLHLVALSAEALRVVGPFDENLPTYGSDRDYLIRLHLAGLPAPTVNALPVPRVDVDVEELAVAHSLTSGLVKTDWPEMERYLAAKWGPDLTQPWLHPFGDETRDWTWWPQPEPVPA